MIGTEQWLGGAALLGVVAACWAKIKLFTWRLLNLLVVRAKLDHDSAKALTAFCWSEMYRTPFGEKHFGAYNDYVQTLDRYQTIGFEMVGWDPIIFWQGWRPLLVSLSVQPVEGGGNAGYFTTLTFIRGCFDLEQLLIKALDRYNDIKHSGEAGNRYNVTRAHGNGSMKMGRYHSEKVVRGSGSRGDGPDAVTESSSPDRRYLKWQRQEIGMPRGSNDPFGPLAFPPTTMAAVERCQRWLDSEKWYKEKDISWRLGILLYGPPGTGKTSFVKAIGRKLNLPIVSYDLASFSNQEFEEEWQRMLISAPCIALLEDVDAVFDGRENRLGDEGGGLTFDCLLNCMGGIKDANGVLIFITTNRPESLDEALGKPDAERGISTRPGRIDLAVELGPLDQAGREKLAERILCDCPDLVPLLVSQGEGDTGAQFTERCSKVALEHYWQEVRPEQDRTEKWLRGLAGLTTGITELALDD